MAQQRSISGSTHNKSQHNHRINQNNPKGSLFKTTPFSHNKSSNKAVVSNLEEKVNPNDSTTKKKED